MRELTAQLLIRLSPEEMEHLNTAYLRAMVEEQSPTMTRSEFVRRLLRLALSTPT